MFTTKTKYDICKHEIDQVLINDKQGELPIQQPLIMLNLCFDRISIKLS
jgi:hypothetical protein